MRNKWLGMMVGLCLAAFVAATAGADIIGTYVDATTTNTTPGSAFSGTESDTDNLWYVDTSRSYCRNADVIVENTATETAPMLTTTVSGLANGTYDVYAVFWTHIEMSWAIDARITGAAEFVACNQWNGTPTGVATSDKVEMYQLLGQAVVTDGSLSVDVQQRAGYARGWYDGISFQPVPEPATMGLLAAGALGMLIRRKR